MEPRIQYAETKGDGRIAFATLENGPLLVCLPVPPPRLSTRRFALHVRAARAGADPHAFAAPTLGNGRKNPGKDASVAVGNARDRSRNRIACRVPLQAARSRKATG